MIVAAGFDSFGNGTFVDENGVDVTLNSNFAIQTSGQFKAAYDFQMNYADQVFTKYGGSMVAAVSAYRNNTQQKLELGRLAGSIDPVAMDGYGMIPELNSFANQYDATLYGSLATLYGEQHGSFRTSGLINQRAAKAYDEKQVMSGLISVANSQVRSDNHPMYKNILDETFSPLLGPGGEVGPLVGVNRNSGDPVYITTRTRYESGEEHGWSRDGNYAMSVDLGTREISLEAIAFANSTILAQGNPFGWRDDSGGYAQCLSDRWTYGTSTLIRVGSCNGQ